MPASSCRRSRTRRWDHYSQLRQPIRAALLGGGDVRPLHHCLRGLTDPKRIGSHKAVVAGLERFFKEQTFTAEAVTSATWSHGDLAVRVRPTAILHLGGAAHVAFVYLKSDPLPPAGLPAMLHLLQRTHGQLGSPLIIEARFGKARTPQRAGYKRRGLDAVLEGEAEAFLRLWNGDLEVA